MNEELLNKIIDVAYGNASLFDKVKIYLMSLKNSEIKNLLHEYKKQHHQLKNLELEDCPDHLLIKFQNQFIQKI